jgi:phosphoribosylanthranilate isomerase
VFVKVCGTTSEADALLAVAMGADAVGFIFAPSPRQITPSVAADIVKRLPPEVLTVGVFRDEVASRVVEIVHRSGLKAAQLSGHERPDVTQWVKTRVPTVFKAFAAGDPGVKDAREHGADVVMIDNAEPGSGQVFDWSLASDVSGAVKLLLAGGLHAGNVGDAIATVHPWGVDVCTGVELEPGRKDARKVRAFVSAVRAASPSSPAKPAGGPVPYDWQDDG